MAAGAACCYRRGNTVNSSKKGSANGAGPISPGWAEKAERFFDGKMSPEKRAEFEREMLRDPAQALAVYTEMGMGPMAHEALQALRIRHLESHARISDRSITKHVPWWGRTRSRLVVFAFAVIAVFLAVTVSKIGDMGPHPVPDRPAGTAGFRILAPAGKVDAVPTLFSWTAYPAASQYRIEIYDDGQLFHTTLTNETTLIVKLDKLAARGLRAGHWRVVPLDDFGSELPPTGSVRFVLSTP
jgi:hypothetical protein